MGTADWKAYALAHLAALCKDKLLLDQASILLKRALERDPEFFAARVNLASLKRAIQKDGDEYRPAAIYRLLRQLPGGTPGYSDMIVRVDPTAFAYHFLSASVAYDAACYDRDHRSDWLFKAIAHTEMLVRSIRLATFFHWSAQPTAYLAWRAPIAACLRLGLALEVNDRAMMEQEPRLTGPWIPKKKAEEKLARLDAQLAPRFDYKSLYNLACTYAIFFAHAPNEPSKKGVWAATALRTLEQSLSLAENVGSSKSESVTRDRRDRIKKIARSDCAFESLRKTHASWITSEPGEDLTQFHGDVFGEKPTADADA